MQKNLKLGIAGICVMAAGVILAILDEHKVVNFGAIGITVTIGFFFAGFIMAQHGFRKWADSKPCDCCRR